MEKQIYEEYLDFNDFSLRFCTSPQKQKRKEIKLYTDLEVETIYEKFLHKKYQTDHQTSSRMKRFQWCSDSQNSKQLAKNSKR